MKGLINFDMDSWWASLGMVNKVIKRENDIIIEKSIPRILKLLNSYNIKSTFFVLGPDVENQTELYKKIIKEGHEIGNHTYSHFHDLKKGQTRKIKEEIKKSHDIIQDKLKVTPIGFRAPNYSFSKKLIPLLKKAGYIYDSSIVPTFIPYYYPFHWLFKSTKPNKLYTTKNNQRFSLLEIPISVSPLTKIPMTGTFVKLLGERWLEWNTKLLKKTGFININFHARDFVPDLPIQNNMPFFVYKNNKNITYLLKSSISYLAKNTQTTTLQNFSEKYL